MSLRNQMKHRLKYWNVTLLFYGVCSLKMKCNIWNYLFSIHKFYHEVTLSIISILIFIFEHNLKYLKVLYFT